MRKVYYQPQITERYKEYLELKDYELKDHPDEMAQWLSQLPLDLKSELEAISRWEAWEATLPPGSNLAKVLREYCRPSMPNTFSGNGLPTASSSQAYAHTPVPCKPYTLLHVLYEACYARLDGSSTSFQIYVTHSLSTLFYVSFRFLLGSH